MWNYTTGNWVESSPAVVAGKVFVGSDDGRVYCLDAVTGAQVWNYTTGNYVFSSPAVADGKVLRGIRRWKGLLFGRGNGSAGVELHDGCLDVFFSCCCRR